MQAYNQYGVGLRSAL